MSIYTDLRKPVAIKRMSGESYIDGHLIEGSETIINIRASIQPMKPEEMQELPEGRRSDEVFKLFTKTKLYTVTNQNPDTLTINSEDYEVISVGKYQSNVISHYKALIAKKANKR